MNYLPEGLKDYLNSITPKIWGYIIYIILVICVIVGIFFLINYEYNDGKWNKKQIITISLYSKKEVDVFKKIELRLDNIICNKPDEKKLEFKCEKPKKGKHKLEFADYIEIISIEDDIYTYPQINVDKKYYVIKEALLELNSSKFSGKVLIVEKDMNAPKYVDNKKEFNLKIYKSNFKATIKNSEIFFSQPWEDFFRNYYLNNKLLNFRT